MVVQFLGVIVCEQRNEVNELLISFLEPAIILTQSSTLYDVGISRNV